MASTDKFCVDCGHHEKRIFKRHICLRSVGREVADEVTGEKTTVGKKITCREARMSTLYGGCGPFGKHFIDKNAGPVTEASK